MAVVHVQTTSAPATAPGVPTTALTPSEVATRASSAAAALVRLTTVTSCTSRTAIIASRWDRACTPAPKITSRCASVRARCRVASAAHRGRSQGGQGAAVDEQARGLGDRVEEHVRSRGSAAAPGRDWRSVRVTSFTPTPGSPVAGITSSAPRGVSTCERVGVAEGSPSAKARSRASIAAPMGRRRASSSPSTNGTDTSEALTARPGMPGASVGRSAAPRRCRRARPRRSGSRSPGRRCAAPCSRSARRRRPCARARGSSG